jgi:uncharacterized protein
MVASAALSPTLTDIATPAATGPTGATERIGTLDFVRGWALFGILFMNITGFGLSHAYSNPVNNGGSTGADLWAWLLVQIGLEGAQRGLFSVLFGAGILLFMERAEKADPARAADIYLRRNLLLVAMGLINAWLLLWAGDILYIYGVTALFALAFRKLSPRWLIGIGIFAFLFTAMLGLVEARDNLAAHDAAQAAQRVVASGGAPSEKQQDAIDHWKEIEDEDRPSAETIQEDIEAHRFSWTGTAHAIRGDVVYLESSYLYRYFGDAFGMMLIGMALLKLGVLTLRRPARLYWAMILVGYGVGLATNISEARWIMESHFSALAFKQVDVTYDVGRLGMMCGHLGALLLLYRSGALPWLRRSVGAVGQMALTNYLSHSLVCLILFTGFGLYGQLHRYQLYPIVAAICAVQLVVSPIWLRHYRFGPVEWLWRALTYGKWPAFRRMAAASA